MKLVITINSDTIYTDFMAALASIKATTQMAELYPQMVVDLSTIVVPMRRAWEFDEDKPVPFGEMVITQD